MVEPTRNPMSRLLDEILQRGTRQLELPLEGIESARSVRIKAALKSTATSFMPQLGANILMRMGIPMVAATTPIAISIFAPQHRDGLVTNLAAGSALGGAWGAIVGAALPYGGAGERISRSTAIGRGAATGVVLAPAIAVVSKYVVDWVTSPVRANVTGERKGD